MQLIPNVGFGVFDPMNGVILALGALVIILAGRTALAYSRGKDPGAALAATGRWTFAVVGGIFTAGFTGLAQAGDLVAQLTAFIAGHPFAVSNAGVGLLGWLGFSGQIALGPNQFVGLALAIVGAVWVVRGVDDFA